LQYLYCIDNQLSSLDISQNTGLIQIRCNINQLTSLDASQNTSLTTLWCHENQLTSLNVANGNNTNLTALHANNNTNLTCINVDDVNYSNTNWTGSPFTFDSGAIFSTTCNGTVGINESNIATMNIAPNPTKYLLNISTTEIVEQVTIYSISGSLVKNINQNIHQVNVKELTEGMYILVVKTENGITHNRFIKE